MRPGFDEIGATVCGTPGSSPAHTLIAPDLFSAETSMGTYQGMTDQIDFSSLPQGFTTVLEAMGASKAE